MESNKVGRPINGDFTGLKSADGFVTIVNKRQGRHFVWVLECRKPGCMCTGGTLTHEYLVNGGDVKCASSGHDSAGSPSINRPTEARCDVRRRTDIYSSARTQMEARQQAADIAAIERGEQ
jgi:hypothetical protein